MAIGNLKFQGFLKMILVNGCSKVLLWLLLGENAKTSNDKSVSDPMLSVRISIRGFPLEQSHNNTLRHVFDQVKVIHNICTICTAEHLLSYYYYLDIHDTSYAK